MIILDHEYSPEDLSDVERDVYESLQGMELPEGCDDSFELTGKFRVVITYEPN